MIIRRTMIGIAACFAIAGARAQTTPHTTPSEGPPTQPAPVMTDAQFLDKAIMSNRFEIETGRLARSKATEPKLKEFGAMMVSDHGKALEELEGIARKLNRPVIAELDSQHRAKLDSLKAKPGSAFDSAYKAEMKLGHAEALLMLQSHRPKAVDDNVKAWIDKALPVILRHKSVIDSM